MIYNFNNFLYEQQQKLNSEYVKEITGKEFFNYLNPVDGNSKYTLYPGTDRIFRQVNIDYNTYGDYNIINPKLIKRRSPNANSNYTNIIISNLPSWKKYPKRNKSLICGDFNRTHGHFDLGEENLFLVIPQNNAKIGMCSQDFWTSFNDFYSLSSLGSVISSLLSSSFDDSWIKTRNRLNKISIKKLQEQFKFNYIKFNLDENKSVIENLDEMLNPENNKFKLTKWNNNFQFDYSFYDGNMQEVWTDSTSLLIRYSVAKKLGLI